MKTKNILMSILLVIGSIAAKAAGYPPELALVSQPVMVYNYNSITVYYDVENIGDYTYRGYVSLYLEPDYGYSYAEKYVRVYPGRIKRIAIDIPLHRIDRRYVFTIMPYYELGNELYSFTTFEYFEPIDFYWDGPRTERWIVITVPPRIRHYHRPGVYRYYYDGFRPPMPPPGHGPMPPMNPHHHTYGYHHSNGGYPATHPDIYNGPANDPAPTATVRPKANGGSMSSGSSNTTNTVAPNNNGGSSSSRVSTSNSGRTGNSSTGTNGNSSSGRVSNSNSSRTSSSSSTSSRVGNSTSSRTDTGTSTRPVINSNSSSRTNTGTSNNGSSRVNNSSSNTSRTSSGTSNSNSRVNSGSSNSRTSSGTSSSSSRVNNSSSNSSRSTGSSNSGSSHASSSNSSTRSSGTSTSSATKSSSSTRSSNSSSSRSSSSNSNRSGSSSGRR